MKTSSLLAAAATLLLAASPLHADPRTTSWFTKYSGQYARLYQSVAAETAGTASTTWSRGAGVQTSATYAGVHDVVYSADWVYIKTTGLGGHVMGPWYLDAAKTQNFGNFPSNTATIYRIPRNPAVPAGKTLTGGGAIGYFVNGVAFFDNRDTFSYSNANGKDADPTAGIGNGDGIWVRDAYPNEFVTFDAALAHQAGNQYHYHVQPIALRYQLGDHVDYNATTNRYTESAAAATAHSPIIAWAQDGNPVYGPYGYATALNATSGVRRMVSGFTLRNGANGTTNLSTTGRHTLATWSAAWQNRATALAANQYGPNVSATYALGHYLEDYDYLGDLGFTQGVPDVATGVYFDLDRYNGRFCVTPEFPGGTYAYFSALNADNTPAFPYNIGRQFYGSPTGGTVTSITETVATAFAGGPDTAIKATNLTRDSGTGAVTMTWSSVEGGTYKIEKTPDLATWGDLQTGVGSGGIATAFLESAASQAGAARLFYRMSRTFLAVFDSNGFATSGGGTGAPTVVTAAATGVSTTGATLNGTVTANNLSTTASFEYGLTTAYGATAAATPATVTGATATSVSAAITSLTAGLTYHFRAKGVNTAGTTYGGDTTFVATGSGGGTSVAPGGSAARGTTVTVTITLPTAPPQPPANLVPTSVTLAGTIAGTGISRPAQGTVIATFAIPANAPVGAQNIVIVFNPAPTYTMTGAFTIQ